MFQEDSSDIYQFKDVVCSYISFSRCSGISTKIVTIFPNTKKWISHDIKSLISNWEKAFEERAPLERERELKKSVRAEIKKANLRCKDKIESELSSNNLMRFWNSMRNMTGSSYGHQGGFPG